MWPFGKPKPWKPSPRDECLHGLVHVALYDCPHCGVIQITTNRTTGEVVRLLGGALGYIRQEMEDALASGFASPHTGGE